MTEEINPHVSGAKLDSNKIRTDLLLDFGLALTAVADLGTTGAIVYSEGGWLDVPKGKQRYTAAMIGHMLKEKYEACDSDTKFRHEVATAWNALARLQLSIMEDKEWKDRLLKRQSLISTL